MQTYVNLLADILSQGKPTSDRTGVGTTYIFGYQWRHDMQTGFPLLTTKWVPLRVIFEELRWFLSGSTDVKELQKQKVKIWDEWATKEQCERFGREEGDLGPVYGALWRQFNCGHYHVDQIARLLDSILYNPQSRRHIVTGWHPGDCDNVALPPCHTLWQIDCSEDGEMSLHLYARSIDAFLGLPFNIASYGLLLEMLCYVTGYTPKDLIISFGNLHIYNNHYQQVAEQVDREPFELPMVTIIGKQGGSGTLDALLDLTWDDIRLSGYEHHPAIKAPVAV